MLLRHSPGLPLPAPCGPHADLVPPPPPVWPSGRPCRPLPPACSPHSEPCPPPPCPLSDLSLDSSDLVMLKSLLAGLSLPSRDGGPDRALDEEGEGEWGWASAGRGQAGLPWVSLGRRWLRLCDAHAAPGGAVAHVTSSTCSVGSAGSSVPLPGCIHIPAPVRGSHRPGGNPAPAAACPASGGFVSGLRPRGLP